MNDLTLIHSYYNNPCMLEFQVRVWQSYSPEVKKVLKFIVIDDCSSVPALPILKNSGLNLRLFRIKKDIPWNMSGARNLGASVADTKWIFLGDIDHYFTAKNIEKILRADLNEEYYYIFNRGQVQDAELNSENILHRSPSFYQTILTKEAYWKAGGYDEDFAGNYGWEGAYFRLNLETKVGLKQRVFDEGVVLNYFNDPHLMKDTMTSGLSRDDTRNHEIIRQKRDGKLHQSNDCLRFEWVQEI